MESVLKLTSGQTAILGGLMAAAGCGRPAPVESRSTCEACAMLPGAPELPPVEVDPDRLARALVYLIRAADGYGAEGAPIRLRVGRAGRELVIGVTAAGPGIPEQDLPQLFDRLRRPPGARRSEDLGLGLFITRLIVEKHGGRVWAQTSPGRESTLFCSIPTG